MPLPPDYPTLLQRLDLWQEDVRTRFPGVVPCRAGCSACCHGPFDISAADALLVRSALAALPEAEAAPIRERAAAQLGRMRELEPGFEAPWDVSRLGEVQFDRLVEALADEPCPALDGQGSCLIYRSRPMVCRVMGIGMKTANGEVIENACPIREEFPVYDDLAPQAFDLAWWEKEEEAALRSAAAALDGSAGSMEYETTVAGAVMLSVFEQ